MARVPMATIATSRSVGYPACPFGPGRGLGKRFRLASVSAIASWVPSIPTTRRPANRTRCGARLAACPASRVNSSRSGPDPTRRIASVSAEAHGRRGARGRALAKA